MRIVHLCLACYYVDGYSYQENILPRYNKEDGHEVYIIASTESFINNSELGYVRPSSYLTEYGVPIVRLPYAKVGPKGFTKKIRKYKGLYKELESFKPDIIMAHSVCFWSVLDVIKYLKNNPNVKFYADTHTAHYNSGLNWLSLYFLHRGVYRWLHQKLIPYLKKYYYIGESEKQFAIINYHVPEEIMEYYPLGGIILSENDYMNRRAEIRSELGLTPNIRLYLHTGKLTPAKRTLELLEAFSKTDDKNCRLYIAGSIPLDQEKIINPLIEADSRVYFLGWKTGEELQKLLCACDLYCQPGSVSATMQNAVCCTCAVMAYPYMEYKMNLDYGNIIWVKSVNDIEKAFIEISKNPKILDVLKENSKHCANELLDYRKLAARLYD